MVIICSVQNCILISEGFLLERFHCMYSCAYCQVYSVMLFVESGMIEVGHQETSVYMYMRM